jgi:hypothetical protein
VEIDNPGVVAMIVTILAENLRIPLGKRKEPVSHLFAKAGGQRACYDRNACGKEFVHVGLDGYRAIREGRPGLINIEEPICHLDLTTESEGLASR